VGVRRWSGFAGGSTYRFFLDGYFAQSGGSSAGNPGYFDLRAVTLWFRVHA
jgi:hypothetical protein